MTATSFSKAGPRSVPMRDSGRAGMRRGDFEGRGAGVERLEIFRFVLRGAMNLSEKREKRMSTLRRDQRFDKREGQTREMIEEGLRTPGIRSKGRMCAPRSPFGMG